MAYAFVQVKENGAAASSTTIASGNLASNPTAGNLYFITVVYQDGAAVAVNNITGLLGSLTYQEIGSGLFGGGVGQRWFVVRNIPGGGTENITVTWASAVTSRGIAVVEYSGFDTTAPYTSGEHASQSEAGPGTGANAINSTATPTLSTQPCGVIGFAFEHGGSSTMAEGTGYTLRDNNLWNATLGLDGCLIDKRVTATTAVESTFTDATNGGVDTYYSFVVALKEAGISPGLGSLTINGFAPSAIKSGDHERDPDPASLVLSGYEAFALNQTKQTPLIESGDATVTTVGTAGSPWAINVPNASLGDLLLFIIAWDDSTNVTSVTAPSGQNGETISSIVGPAASSGTEMRIQAWEMQCTGAWTAGTIDFTPSASETCRAVVVRVPRYEFDPNNAVGASSSSVSAGTAESNINSPAFSAGVSDLGGRLVIGFGSDADAITAPASGTSTVNNATGGGVGLCVVTRDSAVTASESIAAITATIASDSWATVAFVVMAPATNFPANPGTAQLVLSGLAPTVGASGGTSISSGLGQLTLSGLAPDVFSPVQISSGLGALTFTGLAPTISVPAEIVPGVGALVITGLAPVMGVVVSPGLGAITLSGLAPDLRIPVLVASGLGALTFTGLAPTISVPAGLTPGVGALTLSGFAPSQTLTLPAPGNAELVFTGFAPAIGDNRTASTGLGALSITGLAPTVASTANVFASSGVGALVLAGLAPTQQLNIPTGIGSLTLVGLAPSFQTDTGATIIPGLAEMLLNGFPPDLLGGDAPRQGGGRSKRKRRKYELEIDGEVFDVESEAEAVEILDLLKEEAQKLAELAVNRANKAQKRPQRKVLADARKTLVVPEIQASSVIEDAVSSIRAEIENIYKSALDTIEIGTLLKKKEESDDDEEAFLMIL